MIAFDEEKTIYITRGDTTTGEFNRLAFYLPIYNYGTGKEELYEFKPTDKITFVVLAKKGYTKKEVLRKEYILSDLGYMENATVVEIPLTEEDTKKFSLSNKKTTYWYDIALNDTLTVIGFDDEGAKKIIVFPEAE